METTIITWLLIILIGVSVLNSVFSYIGMKHHREAHEDASLALKGYYDFMDAPPMDPYDYDLSLRMRMAEKVVEELRDETQGYLDGVNATPGSSARNSITRKDLAGYLLVLDETTYYLKETRPFMEVDALKAMDVLLTASVFVEGILNFTVPKEYHCLYSLEKVMKIAKKLGGIALGIQEKHDVRSTLRTPADIKADLVAMGLLHDPATLIEPTEKL